MNGVTKGFTLIELMIVMTVIVLISGGSIAAYTSFNTNQQITNDSRRLVVELSKTRSAVATLQFPSGCNGLRGVNVSSKEIDGVLVGVEKTTLCDSGNLVEPVSKILNSSIFAGPFDMTFLPGSGYLSSGDDGEIAIVDQSNPSVGSLVTVGRFSDIYSEATTSLP